MGYASLRLCSSTFEAEFTAYHVSAKIAEMAYYMAALRMLRLSQPRKEEESIANHSLLTAEGSCAVRGEELSSRGEVEGLKGTILGLCFVET